jgi:hypothetical protein
MSNFNAFYTLESGAEKKRKKSAEQEYWNSLNSAVVIVKDKDER